MNNALRDHIAPITRTRFRTPEAWKRSAIRLYYRTNRHVAAYVYGVHGRTIYRWSDTIRL